MCPLNAINDQRALLCYDIAPSEGNAVNFSQNNAFSHGGLEGRHTQYN